MRDHHQPELPPGLHAGRLEGISLPDLLWAVCSRRMTGVLELSRETCRKQIYVQNGQIVFAASGDPDDRLGELLLRDGSISLDQLKDALARQEPGKRLGALLVEAGHLSPDKLVAGVLAQVERIVLGVFTWEDGEYRFEEGPLPTQEVITLGMKTGEILLRGIRRIRSFSRIRRSVGPPRTCYRVTHGFRHALDGLGLSDGEEMLLGRLEGLGETVENLCREVFLSNFEIYHTLWAMKVLGVIEEVERPVEVDDAVDEGDVDSSGIAPVLVRLCRAGETGVLHVIHGPAERTIHIKEGHCVFATSNDFEDGLLAYLLRRGVISLRDREETAKRLLSNKRVGTILRELGVIDEADLRAMVREQLSEIIYDTLTWDSGEYTFVSGELPTIEEITLEASLESLVSTGLRRIQSWSRVYEGCGGSEMQMSLAPAYLEVLDRMNASTKEWEVVSRIKEPRTMHEISRDAEMSDFAVCQTLWVLRTLGAVDARPFEPGEAEESAEADAAPAEATAAAAATAAGTGSDGDGWASELADELSETNDEVPAYEVAAPGGVEAEPETDPAEDPTLGIHDEDTEAALAAEEGSDEPESPPLDSPGDATTFIPREEVEAALRGEEDAAGPECQLADESDNGDALEAASPAIDEPVEADRPIESWDESSDESPADDGNGEDGSDRWRGVFDEARRREEELVEDEPSAEDVVEVEATADEQPVEEPDWDPPEGLDADIARFNAQQRVLYRTIRAEIGAGAANFVRSCTGRLARHGEDPFSAAELRSDGSWDVDSLRRVARDMPMEPASGYERVIEAEIEALSIHIGEVRAQALREKVEQAAAAVAPDAP
jgi:hypothetical protein